MLKSNRQKEIMKVLQTKGSVEISQLCRIFGVVEMTIQRDLSELIQKGGIIRVHGGAILPEDNILSEPPFDIRNRKYQQEKEAIARAAFDMIEDGQKILLDSGTTTFSLAKIIDNSKRLIVVTNAINIASELNVRSNVSVLSLGGNMRKNTLACVGHFTESMISNLKVDITFLGVGGISETGKLSGGSVAEVGVKQAMIEAGKQIIVLADSSKIGREEFVLITNIKNVDLLITDSKAPEKIINRYKKMGVEIKIAD
ncbi:MAG: DeoR/GlpR family DNA-binding transcription regulator [Candidatus Omnitrophota bacterium]